MTIIQLRFSFVHAFRSHFIKGERESMGVVGLAWHMSSDYKRNALLPWLKRVIYRPKKGPTMATIALKEAPILICMRLY